MEILNSVLPIILYVLGSILIVIFIIIGVKIIRTMNKIDNIVEDVNEKVESLSKLFNIFDFAADRLSFLGDRITDKITAFIIGLFKKKKEKKEEECCDE
ncbi:MAG: hypothetical protein PHS45_00070 [Bacilli bacterium]|nr:hypothetical protein [Bacilli bacterium]